MVSPRTPVRTRPWRGLKRPVKLLKESAVEDISRLVSEIESDGKGIPTLMKHYLNLDAQFIGFSRDKAFSNAIDGLVVVDLLNTEKRLLKRFLGDEGTQIFYSYHQGQYPGGQEQAA
jgi:tryptophan synthase alpha subunit